MAISQDGWVEMGRENWHSETCYWDGMEVSAGQQGGEASCPAYEASWEHLASPYDTGCWTCFGSLQQGFLCSWAQLLRYHLFNIKAFSTPN